MMDLCQNPTVLGIGADIIETGRLGKTGDKEGLAEEILSPSEIFEIPAGGRRDIVIGKHFALKEAVLKALGCGLSDGSYWREIEILKRGEIRLHGKIREIAERKKVKDMHYSYSITRNYIVASVFLIR